MSSVNGTDYAVNPLCEWIISTNENKTIEIEIDRAGPALEEINIRYHNSSGVITEVTSKDLFSCNSSSFELDLENITKIEIRTLLLNNSFDFSLLMVQKGKDLTYPKILTQFKALVEEVAAIVVFLFIIMALTIVVFSLFKNYSPFFRSEMENFK